jgi:hypothetical protein
MKQYDITVTVRVTVSDEDPQFEAMYIGNQLAEMSLKYKSIGADQILEVTAKEADNV